MADKNIGKITQIIGAVIDVKFTEGSLPEINEAVTIATKDSGTLTVEVAQHLGADIQVQHGHVIGGCERLGTSRIGNLLADETTGQLTAGVIAMGEEGGRIVIQQAAVMEIGDDGHTASDRNHPHTVVMCNII